MHKNTYGFTLIELAVAMFIIVLLLGSILVPLTTQVEQRQISDAQKTLEEIKEVLIGYALTNGYLPCPDTNNDGLEDRVAGRCGAGGTSITGNLPWSDLGIASADVWGNRFRYVINESFARSDIPFSLNTTGTNVRVCTTTVPSCATTLSTTAVAAVLSLGRNGYGATNSLSGAQNPAASSLDEQENYDTDRDVVSRTRTEIGSTVGEFDDIVTWLSKYTLYNRMVTAGKLP
jgi:prepilin-type N-terminal cleavage/methylation domain-containing protein